MKFMRKLMSGQEGAAAVEFTLVLPVILLIMFSVIELGSAWYARQMLVNASREGARFGALFTTAGNADVEEHVTDVLTQAGFPGEPEVVSDGAEGVAGVPVQVTVTADWAMPVLGNIVPGVNPTVTLSASTVMRHE